MTRRTANDRFTQQRQLQKRLGQLLFERKRQTLAVYVAPLVSPEPEPQRNKESRRTNDQRQILLLPTARLIPDRTQPLRDKLGRVVRRLLVDDHQIHALPDQPTAHPNVDGRLLPIPGQHPHLDPRLLQRVDRVGHPFLELVLDRRRPEQKHVFFDQLGGLVEGLPAPVDGRRGLRVDGSPLAVLGRGNVAIGDAERAEAIGGIVLSIVRHESERKRREGTHFEMRERLFGKQLVFAQPLENDRVGAFAVQLDLAVRCAHDRRHALSRRIELAHV